MQSEATDTAGLRVPHQTTEDELGPIGSMNIEYHRPNVTLDNGKAPE